MEKNIYEISKEFNEEMLKFHKLNDNREALFQELYRRFYEMRDTILDAWFAEHGFAPGKAVLVEDRSEGLVRWYIRESTADEAERALTLHNRPITPCPKCELSCQLHLSYCGWCGMHLAVRFPTGTAQ